MKSNLSPVPARRRLPAACLPVGRVGMANTEGVGKNVWGTIKVTSVKRAMLFRDEVVPTRFFVAVCIWQSP